MRLTRSLIPWIIGLMLVAWGCSDNPSPEPEGPVGSFAAALQVAVQHDVTDVEFHVVAPSAGCDGAPIASKTIALESEALPPSVAGPGAGSHQFADGLFVLAPGQYKVCATPLANGVPSAECAPVSTVVTVVAEQTTEVVLVSQCAGDPDGAVDVVAALNDPPQITDLAINPSKFITVCELSTITVTASDPDGDAITYSWTIVSGPPGGSLIPSGPTATFSGQVGDYVIKVSVLDIYNATTSLTFPIHVSDAVCQVSQAVQDIFMNRCTPCHTVGSSGGLHLNPATASYANLVNKPSSAAACANRVRVIPGNAPASYIIAKLRAQAGICGVPMPRNLPPLPEAEINVIESWINGLPH